MIEVNKAVTPDMEGDAIGGSVNLNNLAPHLSLLQPQLVQVLHLFPMVCSKSSIDTGNRIANDKIDL